MNVIWGLVLSTMLGFGSGWLVAKITTFLCKGMERRKTTRFFRGAQIGGGAAMAFMHGAQDGQKFMGVFMLGIFLSNGNGDVESFQIPLWLMVLCSLVMGIGTSIGGYRIIKAVGMDMVKLETYQGFAGGRCGGRLLAARLPDRPPRQHHPHQNHRHHGGAARPNAFLGQMVGRQGHGDDLGPHLSGRGLIGFLMARLFVMIF